MFETLIKVLPLDLAATLSPGILAITIILLGSKSHPKLKVISFFLGSFLAGLGVALAGFYIAKSVSSGFKPNETTAIIDLVLGIIFMVWAFKLLLEKERKIKHQKSGDHLLRLLIVGFIVSATNFDAVLLSLAASREVGSSGLSTLTSIILIAINILFFTLPIILPAVIQLIIPKIAKIVLEKINRFLTNYGRFIVFIMFIAFGIYFAVKGLCFLIK